MDYKDEGKNPTTFNSSSQHRDYNLITLKQYLSIVHSAFIQSQTSNQQGRDLRVLPNCDIILMPPVPACQAFSLDKGECSTPHRIKFKQPGGKQQCREPRSGRHFPTPPSPFTHRSMWFPPDKTTFTMLSAVKLNSFSQPCVCIVVFPLGQCVSQTGMSESSGDRNTTL